MNKIADSERRKRIRSRLRKATWSLGLFHIRLHRSKLIPMDRLFFTSSLSHFYKLISPVLFTIAILIMNLLMPELPRKPFHRRSRSDQARNSDQKNHRNNIGPISFSEKKIRNQYVIVQQKQHEKREDSQPGVMDHRTTFLSFEPTINGKVSADQWEKKNNSPDSPINALFQQLLFTQSFHASLFQMIDTKIEPLLLLHKKNRPKYSFQR